MIMEYLPKNVNFHLNIVEYCFPLALSMTIILFGVQPKQMKTIHTSKESGVSVLQLIILIASKLVKESKLIFKVLPFWNEKK